MDPVQEQAYLLWLNKGTPPGALGDAFLGGPLQLIASAFAVTTVAQLRTVVGQTGATALVMGYTTMGDKAAVVYNWSASASSTDNGGTIIKPTAVSGNGRWLLPPADGGWVNLTDFGGGLGAADDTAALVNALSTGFNVRLPAGTIPLNTQTDDTVITISGKQTILGAGTYQSIVSTTITTGVLFRITQGACGLQNMQILGIGMTDGWAVFIDGTGDTNFTNQVILSDMIFQSCAGLVAWGGAQVNQTNFHTLHANQTTGGSCSIVDGSDSTIKAAYYGWNDNSSSNSGPIFAHDILIGGVGTYVHLYLNGFVNSSKWSTFRGNNGDTLLLTDNTFGVSGAGGNPNLVPQFVYMEDTAAQTCTATLSNNAAYCLNSGNIISFVNAFANHIGVDSSGVGSGMYVGPNVTDVKLFMPRFNSAEMHMIDIFGGQVLVFGGTVEGANRSNTSSAHANVVVRAGSANVHIVEIDNMGGANTAIDVDVIGGTDVQLLGNAYSASTAVVDAGFLATIDPPVSPPLLTWTPALSFATPGDQSFTYINQFGSVSRNGAEITINILIVGSVTYTTATGNLSIALPTPAPDGGNFGTWGLNIAKLHNFVLDSGYTQAIAYIAGGVSLINLIEVGSGKVEQSFGPTNLPSGTSFSLFLSGSYTTATH